MLAARLPSETQYHTGWVTQTIPVGEEVDAFDYHEAQDAYVIGTNHKDDFKAADKEILHDFGSEGKTSTDNRVCYFRSRDHHADHSFPPQIDRGAIKLLDRATKTIIDQYVQSFSSPPPANIFLKPTQLTHPFFFFLSATLSTPPK